MADGGTREDAPVVEKQSSNGDAPVRARQEAGTTPQETVSQVRTPADVEPYQVPRAVAPRPVPEGAALDHPALSFNRELGWIDFNWRVLWQAMDERTPLLERVRFVAITASNLDEFVQKRVGGLRRQEEAGVTRLTADGRTPSEQLELLRKAIVPMHRAMTRTWEDVLKPRLCQEAQIHICDYEELTPFQKEELRGFFNKKIYPILTPLVVGPGHPFPFISNLSLSLATILRHKEQDTIHFSRVKIPTERWVPVPHDPEMDLPEDFTCLLPVEQLMAQHLDEVFAGMEVLGVYPFRLTRNADLRRAEEEAEDLLALISEELRERRFAPVVRLEVAAEMPQDARFRLMKQLELNSEDVYEVNGLLDLTDLFAVADIDRPAFKYSRWEPIVPTALVHEGETEENLDFFAILRGGDLMVHHPYESFAATTQRFIEEAAEDPHVLAIKHTLYRTSDQSPTVEALIDAADQGKQVAVLVEVKARFDEANNIEWGQVMENAGIHVTYGLVGLKTHTKATLVIRQEEDEIRTYCHIGTGNYNAKTARIYTDLGLFTCRPDIGQDLVKLFHSLTGYAPAMEYEKVLVAPRTMRPRFEELIQQEIEHQRVHGTGRIIAKMNGLDDPAMVRELYRASQAGVQVDLIVRGHSTLRPGLPGYSENIRIVSIVGRFLEHDRIYYFHNNGDPVLFIGSADWRTRNLKSRVELITPVDDRDLRRRLVNMLELALEDNRLAWELDAEGQYVLRRPGPDEPERNFHKLLMEWAREQQESEAVHLQLYG